MQTLNIWENRGLEQDERKDKTKIEKATMKRVYIQLNFFENHVHKPNYIFPSTSYSLCLV